MASFVPLVLCFAAIAVWEGEGNVLIIVGVPKMDLEISGGTAILYSGFNFISGPTNEIRALNSAIGAFKYKSGSINTIYAVDCDKIDTLPNVTFTINGAEFVFTPNEYVVSGLEIHDEEDSCVSIFWEQDGIGLNYLFGSAFMKHVYTQFNFEEETIGFARTV